MQNPGPATPERKGALFCPGSRAHFLYNLALEGALILAAPVWIPWVALAPKRRRNFPDRLGLRLDRIPASKRHRRVWIHAVSVGETLSSVPLVRALKNRLPAVDLFFSTVTLTGQEVARKSLGNLVEATFFFPFDLPGITGKFLDRVLPDVVAVLETEIWPNFLGECAERGISVVILNGRISERSFRGYGRVRSFFRRVLACVTFLAMQTEEDARRIVALGADPEKVSVTGNMKFDVAAPPPESVSPFLSWLKGEKSRGTAWFVAGSTHEGEEAAVLSAFEDARSGNSAVRLLLAPRHPERFDAVEDLCVRRGWQVAKKTRILEREEESAPVVLLDTVGELLSAYGAADIAFVGGSLVPKGGHNILEPALFGVPMITGRHMENFREMVELFSREDALTVVRDGAELSRKVAEWSADPSLFAEKGMRAKRLLETLRGATERNAALVERELSRRAGAIR